MKGKMATSVCAVALLAANAIRVASSPVFFPDDTKHLSQKPSRAAVVSGVSLPSDTVSSESEPVSADASQALSANDTVGSDQSLAARDIKSQINKNFTEKKLDAYSLRYQDVLENTSNVDNWTVIESIEGNTAPKTTVTKNTHRQLAFENRLSKLPTSYNHSPGDIVFPDWREHVNFSAHLVPSCDGDQISAVHPVTGICHLLGSPVGCPDQQLFLLDKHSGKPTCRAPPCPEDQLMFGNACRPVEDPLPCPQGMSLAQDEYGDGVCDCRSGYVPWPATGRCYPALRQGPCPFGYYLSPIEKRDINKGHRPVCTESACKHDGSFFWVQQNATGCYPLQQPDAGCESEQMLQLNVTTGQLICRQMDTRAIFDLPTMHCADEYLRDFAGRCRSKLSQSFRDHRR